MKFGKSLSNQIEETLPEWRDKFLSYKELKKCLKRIRPSPSPSPPHHTNSNDDNADADAYDGPQSSSKRPRLLKPPLPHPLSATAGVTAGVAILSSSSLSPTQQPSSSSSSVAATAATNATSEELDFMRLLEEELDKFNTFFLEKEEEYVIRQKDLQDRMLAAANDSKEDLMKTRKEIVDFHGEMVLLENYSALNYTGLVKILKKYDKRTGALLRLPFIQKVLQQPFFTTDLLYKLVKECETMLDCLFPAKESPAAEANTESTVVQQPPESGSSSIARGAIPDLEEIEYIESLYMKSTVAALRVLKEIRKGSSTVSVFSLPPLQSTNGLEDRWGKIPVLEQEAK